MHRATRVPYGGSGASRQERVLEAVRVIGVNLLFTALVVFAGYYLFLTYQVKQHETQLKRQEVEDMRRDLDRTLAVNHGLKRQAAFLRTEAGVEKVAREKLGLIRPNEVSYVVVNGSRVRPPATEAESRPRARSATPAPKMESRSFPFNFQIFWTGHE